MKTITLLALIFITAGCSVAPQVQERMLVEEVIDERSSYLHVNLSTHTRNYHFTLTILGAQAVAAAGFECEPTETGSVCYAYTPGPGQYIFLLNHGGTFEVHARSRP